MTMDTKTAETLKYKVPRGPGRDSGRLDDAELVRAAVEELRLLRPPEQVAVAAVRRVRRILVAEERLREPLLRHPAPLRLVMDDNSQRLAAIRQAARRMEELTYSDPDH